MKRRKGLIPKGKRIPEGKPDGRKRGAQTAPFFADSLTIPIMHKTLPTVISLGGSLIAPVKGIDTAFLKRFRTMIRRRISRGERFILVCGGGVTARHYQAAAKKLGHLTREDIDWLGIHSTRLNAHLVRAMFDGDAHASVITNPNDPPRFRESILVAAGWRPGWSTDYIAVLLANEFGAKTVINLSDINHVYSADPKTDKTAVPLEHVTWKEFRRIVGDRWDPGANLPFDPVASKRAQKLGLTVKMVKGQSSRDVVAALVGKRFTGTVIG